MIQDRVVAGVDQQLGLGLRNCWYPVFRSSDLGDAPIGIKRLAADLVVRHFPEHGPGAPSGPIVSPAWFARRLGARAGETGVNRIVAGLCSVTVVVEARDRSGALITADFALEEGRSVFAVPGEAERRFIGFVRSALAPLRRGFLTRTSPIGVRLNHRSVRPLRFLDRLFALGELRGERSLRRLLRSLRSVLSSVNLGRVLRGRQIGELQIHWSYRHCPLLHLAASVLL